MTDEPHMTWGCLSGWDELARGCRHWCYMCPQPMPWGPRSSKEGRHAHVQRVVMPTVVMWWRRRWHDAGSSGRGRRWLVMAGGLGPAVHGWLAYRFGAQGARGLLLSEDPSRLTPTSPTTAACTSTMRLAWRGWVGGCEPAVSQRIGCGVHPEQGHLLVLRAPVRQERGVVGGVLGHEAGLYETGRR